MKSVRRLTMVAALAVLSLSTSAFAQVQVQKEIVKPNGRVVERTRVYNGIRQNAWYTAPAVRQQLNLNDDQYGRLNNSYNTAWTSYNNGVTQLGPNLTDAQRTQQMSELNGNFYNTWNQSTNTAITDPAARARFSQAHWQYQHYGAFNDPTVRQQLKLTDEQTQKFQGYDREWNQNMATWHKDYPNNQQSVNDKFNQAQEQYQNNVNTVLTPEQRQQWQTMSGKPYKFTPDVYFNNEEVTTAKPVIK